MAKIIAQRDKQRSTKYYTENQISSSMNIIYILGKSNYGMELHFTQWLRPE